MTRLGHPVSDSSPRSPWLRRLDRLWVAASAFVWTAALAGGAPGFAEPRGWVALGLGAVAGYVLADFASGLVHWLADRYFDPRTPVLGPALIRPFREHHADALAMTRHDFFEISGNNALVTLPLALVLWTRPTPTSFESQLGFACLASLGLAAVVTNQLHCWAHRRQRPGWVRRLQDWGLILSPAAHALHHRRAHDRAYCVTSGWLNPLLDGIGFFRRLEQAIERIPQSTGSMPRA